MALTDWLIAGCAHARSMRDSVHPLADEARSGLAFDWTPLLTGFSPARMAASLAAPTPSSYRTCTDYSLPVSRRTAKDSGHYRLID